MIDFQAYLEGLIPDSEGNPIARWRRIAYLYTTNGFSWNVTGWGSHYSSYGHPAGLSQNEALNLITYSAYLQGLFDGGITWVYRDIDLKISEYLKDFPDLDREAASCMAAQIEGDRQLAETAARKHEAELARLRSLGRAS